MRHGAVRVIVDVSVLVSPDDNSLGPLTERRTVVARVPLPISCSTRMIRTEESIARPASPLQAILSKASAEFATAGLESPCICRMSGVSAGVEPGPP